MPFIRALLLRVHSRLTQPAPASTYKSCCAKRLPAAVDRSGLLLPFQGSLSADPTEQELPGQGDAVLGAAGGRKRRRRALAPGQEDAPPAVAAVAAPGLAPAAGPKVQLDELPKGSKTPGKRVILWSECSLPVAYVKRGGHNSLPSMILKHHMNWDDQKFAASYRLLRSTSLFMKVLWKKGSALGVFLRSYLGK